MYHYICEGGGEYSSMGGGPSASLIMPEREPRVLISCYQFGYWKHVIFTFDKCSKKLEGNCITENMNAISLLVQAASCYGRVFCLFVRLSALCCQGGNGQQGFYVAGSCLQSQRVLSEWSQDFSSFYLKCPLACNICAGCYAEGGGRKKEKEILYQLLP